MNLLNPDIDLPGHRANLEKNGLTVVKPFLTEQAANNALKDMAGPVPWDLALTNENGPTVFDATEMARMTPPQRHKVFEDVRTQARLGFSTLYYRQDLIPGDSPYMRELTGFIASDEWIRFSRELTGDTSLVRADLHATMYSEGCFLRTHDDTYVGKHRKYAFVIGLTQGWQADWGGLFNMLDDQGKITLTTVPSFNTLTIFKVPQNHFVSQVASYANRRRYACTGWLFAED